MLPDNAMQCDIDYLAKLDKMLTEASLSDVLGNMVDHLDPKKRAVLGARMIRASNNARIAILAAKALTKDLAILRKEGKFTGDSTTKHDNDPEYLDDIDADDAGGDSDPEYLDDIDNDEDAQSPTNETPKQRQYNAEQRQAIHDLNDIYQSARRKVSARSIPGDQQMYDQSMVKYYVEHFRRTMARAKKAGVDLGQPQLNKIYDCLRSLAERCKVDLRKL